VIKSRKMRWTGHVASKGELRIAYNPLVGKPDGKRPLGRPSRRWEDYIKMDHKGNRVERCGQNSSGSGQGPEAGSSENGNFGFHKRKLVS
jgi:hypothetical protein